MGRRAKKRKAAAVASGVERSGDNWRPSRRQAKAEEQPKPVYREAAWGAEEDDKLRGLVAQGGGPGDWAGKAVELGGRDPNDVWTRWYLHLDPERVAVLAKEQRHGWTGDTTASASSQAGGDGDAQQEPNKRARSEPRSTTAGATTDEGGQPKEAAVAQPASGPTLSQASFRFPKKKMAMFFGFLGRAYQGFQRNPGAVTIEDALESAIYRAGGIMPSNYGELRKIGWSRSARTDKGVSAASCCVGMKLCMPRPLAGMVAAINACLPPDITMHTMVPATNGFDAKNNCSQRRYEYLLPAYALGRPALGVSVAEGAGAADLAPSLEALRTQLRYFCGTHSFHNYTPHLKSTDAQAKRYILSFEASDPFVVGGMALVRCTVLGQSFLMHQIRKMIGMAVMTASGRAPPHMIEASLAPHATFPTPMAPGLGLLLDETIFNHYNDRNRTAKEKQSQADRNVEPHTDVTVDSVRGAVEAYKLNTIYPSIVAEELRSKPFATFLEMADTNPVNYEMAATRALCAAVGKPGVVSWATSPQAATPTPAGMLTHGYVYVDELAEDGNIGDGGGAKEPPPAMMGAETVAAVHRLLARRQAAREAKNYGEADATRAELRALGVTVFDAKQRAHHHPPLNTDDSEKQGETAAVSGGDSGNSGGGGGSAVKGTWSVIHE